jgi:sugar phosphate isomerase/epimerase
MRIGLFLALFADRPLDEALDLAVAAGCEAVELVSTASSPHCRPAELLADAKACAKLATAVSSRGLTVSALSCHGNPLHPDPPIAEAADCDFRTSVRLAAELGVGTVITFSGCPGESERSLRPSWVTCSWPDDYPETLEWQWRERVLPYWVDAAAFAGEHGVRVAIEPHPGFVVYNTASMVRLRAAAGDAVGANFDPSHLFWQQMDPIACVRALGGAIFHVHAKDTGFDDPLLAVNGVLETARRPSERAWIFRSVGEGHPVSFWRGLAGALREVGYDGTLSIEHEDPLLSPDDGLRRALSTLREALA